jgi:uncharacterized protein (DUF2384 family)
MTEEVFEKLPNRVKAALRSIDKNGGPETEIWLQEPIPALGGKSIIDVLAEPDGERAVVLYCNTVKGKLF